MAIKNWHGGKLVLCWAVALSAVVGALNLPTFDYLRWNASTTPQDWVLAVVVDTVATVGPVVLFALTWKWFSEKEKKG